MLGRLTNWWPESHREIRSYEAYKGIKIRLSSNELKKKFLYFFFASIFFVKKGYYRGYMPCSLLSEGPSASCSPMYLPLAHIESDTKNIV